MSRMKSQSCLSFSQRIAHTVFAIHSKSALSCAATHDCATIHTCVGWPHGSFSKRGSNNYTAIMGWACVQPFQGCPINCMSKSMISHLDSGSHRVNYVNLPVLLRLTNVIFSECWLVFTNMTWKFRSQREAEKLKIHTETDGCFQK